MAGRSTRGGEEEEDERKGKERGCISCHRKCCRRNSIGDGPDVVLVRSPEVIVITEDVVVIVKDLIALLASLQKQIVSFSKENPVNSIYIFLFFK